MPHAKRDSSATIGRRSALAGAVAAALPLSRARAAIVGNCVVGKDGWLFPLWDRYESPDASVPVQVLNLVTTAVDVLRQHGIETMISFMPTKSRIYFDYLPDGFRIPPAITRRYAAGLEAFNRAGIVAPDLATMFATSRKRDPAAQLYFKTDTHWTSVAATLAATDMAQQIKGKVKLPPSTAPGVTLGPPSVINYGERDLADMLPAKEQDKLPRETYVLRQPVYRPPNALLGADAPDIEVVGSSYMHSRFGYSNILSVELNRPVGLDWHIHLFSPYWDLLNFLHSDGFKKARPKVIVWNVHEGDLEFRPDDAPLWSSTVMSATKFLTDLRSSLA